MSFISATVFDARWLTGNRVFMLRLSVKDSYATSTGALLLLQGSAYN